MPDENIPDLSGWRASAYGWLSSTFLSGAEPGRSQDTQRLAWEAQQLSRQAPTHFLHLSEAFLEAGELLWMRSACDLTTEHRALLGHAVNKACPPYETLYGTSQVDFQQSQVMADIAGFFLAFGLEIVPGRERVDHIASELEFMHALASKERAARTLEGTEKLDIVLDAERRFLADHLGRWGTTFGDRLARSGGTGFYPAWGTLLRTFLEADARHLGLGSLDPVQISEEALASQGPIHCLAAAGEENAP